MNKMEEKPKKLRIEENEPRGSEEETSLEVQVGREFEYSAELGQSEPGQGQVKNESSELDYMLPSPMNSREDAAFTNINTDQKGRAMGVANQRNEPVDILDKVEGRDEDRWALNPASVESDE